MALGAGFAINARSLATSLVRPTHFASINIALSISMSIGSMVAGPMLAATWHRGLVLGGAWLGLPFLVAGGLFALVNGVTWAIRLRDDGGVALGSADVGEVDGDEDRIDANRGRDDEESVR